MKRYLITILVLIITLTLGLLMSCSQPTPAPTMPAASPRITKDWHSYDNDSLGIAFKYPATYILLIDDPINSGIQIKSDSIFLSMIANPLFNKSVEILADELKGKGFRELNRIHIQKGPWKGLRLQGKVTKIGVPSFDEVVYMVKAPYGSLFTCLAISTVESPDFTEVDIIWDSLVLRLDSFVIPPSLLEEAPMATLQPKSQGYTIHYPQPWQAISMSEGLIFIQDPDNPNMFVISILKTQPAEANVDKATEHALDALVVFDDVILLSQHEVSFSGAQDAVMLVGSAKFEDGGPAVFNILLVLTKDITYKVEVVADATKWESLSPVFDKVFNSFTLDIQ